MAGEAKKHGSAAELLRDWRAAERDVSAAREDAESAQAAASVARREKVEADQPLQESALIAAEAAQAYRDAARKGFPKD